MLNSSWLQIFNQHMLSAQKLVTQEKYTQYIETMQFYVDLVVEANTPAKHATSMQLGTKATKTYLYSI